MSYSQITQAKNADAVLLGLGTLGLAASSGSSPFTFADVGYLKGVEVAYTREFREFSSAGLLVKRLVFSDRLEMTAQWAEVSITNLSKFFVGSSTVDQINFGGSKSINKWRTKFEHQRSDSKWLTVEIFQAVPGGDINLAFDEEEFIQFPANFVAEVKSTESVGQQYGRIRLHEA